MNQAEIRHKIRHNTHQDEHQSVTQLLHCNPLSTKARQQILSDARQLVLNCRGDKNSSGTLDAFLLEFGLSNAEGVALMCLAEALLRVPDALTADAVLATANHLICFLGFLLPAPFGRGIHPVGRQVLCFRVLRQLLLADVIVTIFFGLVVPHSLL